MARSIVAERDGVVVGVDTHADIHVAVALSSLGARLGSTVVATTPTGFGELVGWATEFGPVRCFGVEPGATGQPWLGTYEPWATPWWRWTALTGGPDACRARACGCREYGSRCLHAADQR